MPLFSSCTYVTPLNFQLLVYAFSIYIPLTYKLISLICHTNSSHITSWLLLASLL